MSLTPVIRITFGLVLLTTSILLTGNLLGLTPDTTRATLEARQQFCETLAVQLTLALSENNVAMAQNTIEVVVDRDPRILSAALRKADGLMAVETPGHRRHWQALDGGISTATHVQVPVFQKQSRWGTVEISFRPLQEQGLKGLLARPFIQLLLFVTLSGSLVYYLLIKKALKYLDPSSVIPGRVKAAMDVLSEGVILMDDKGRIVLANTAFASKLGAQPDSLLGKQLSQLKWTRPGDGQPLEQFPWDLSQREGQNRTGIQMRLRTEEGNMRTLMVNSAPILDGKGKARGSLTTFDDVTQLERKNTQLEEMLEMLQESQEKVRRQNEQLQILASSDSLTSCLNRRALFERMDVEYDKARHTGKPLSCLMCDIDHFKQVNDLHGHVMGDQVISEVARALMEVTRDSDVVGRYGGEEFCILLPNMSAEHATEIATRLRARIAGLAIDGIRVTSSFGLTSTEFGATDPQELIQEADTALYQAKENGRNRVVIWNEQTNAEASAG